MKWPTFLLILLLLTLLNAGNLIGIAAVSDLQIRPDLLLIALVFFACNRSTSEAMFTSFLIGLAADVSCESWVLGPHTLTFLVFGTMVSLVRRVVVIHRFIFQALTVLLVGLLANTAVHLLTYLKTDQRSSNVLWAICGSAIYSAVVGPILWKILSMTSGWLGIRQQAPYSQRHYGIVTK